MNIVQEKIKERNEKHDKYIMDVATYIKEIEEEISRAISNMPCNKLNKQVDIKISIPIMANDIDYEDNVLDAIKQSMQDKIHIRYASYDESFIHLTLWVSKFSKKEKRLIRFYELFDNIFAPIIIMLFTFIVPVFVYVYTANMLYTLTTPIVTFISFLFLSAFTSMKIENRIYKMLEEKRK